jgi:threonine dehydrogenase-like Zn-dependent dehydrogenase
MNRSFVLHAVKDVAIEDRAAPKLKDPWDIIVQVAQTGICGSDVSFRFDPSLSRKWADVSIPIGPLVCRV